MKFDLIISNPPYNNGLDLRILKEIYSLGDKFCLVHPSTWLYDKKNINPTFKAIKTMVKNDFEHYEVVENTNEIFGIDLFNDSIITLFNKNAKEVKDVYSVDFHGDSDISKSIKAKVLKYCEKSNLQMLKVDKKQIKTNAIFSISSRVHGGFDSNEFFSILNKKDKKAHTLIPPKYDMIFQVDKVDEIDNILSFLDLKIIRYSLSIYKVNEQRGNKELLSVPYMPTYTHEWTDEMVAKEIGLTHEEMIWMINWIPDFYYEDAEKYAKYFDPNQTDRQLINIKCTYGGHKA